MIINKILMKNLEEIMLGDREHDVRLNGGDNNDNSNGR